MQTGAGGLGSSLQEILTSPVSMLQGHSSVQRPAWLRQTATQHFKLQALSSPLVRAKFFLLPKSFSHKSERVIQREGKSPRKSDQRGISYTFTKMICGYKGKCSMELITQGRDPVGPVALRQRPQTPPPLKDCIRLKALKSYRSSQNKVCECVGLTERESKSLFSYQVYSLHRQAAHLYPQSTCPHSSVRTSMPAVGIQSCLLFPRFSQARTTFSILLCDVGLGAYKLFCRSHLYHPHPTPPPLLTSPQLGSAGLALSCGSSCWPSFNSIR